MVWIPLKEKVPVAMTIAGSDSGGGAGIEADLKTFAALGVHGTVAITSITAQNTRAVTGVQDVSPEMVSRQIEAVVNDIGIDAAKTGMLHTSQIIEAVAREVKRYAFPLVVDPVMIAKSGAPLLKPEAKRTLIKLLLPVATVLTPNLREAEEIAGMKIRSMEDARRAARRIANLGPKAVVVKGGHMGGDSSVDIFYQDGTYKYLEAPRIETKTTHGTGCVFSAAIAAELAKGRSLIDAVKTAKEIVTAGIMFGIPIGGGHGPVNPTAILYMESERWNVLCRVRKAVEILESSNIGELAPEVGMNVAMALPYAKDRSDVAAVPGRLRRMGKHVRSASCPEFGVSSHLASYILEAMSREPMFRAALNIKYSEKILRKLRDKGLLISSYDRREEPEHVKRVEGATIPWGMKTAIERVGRVPDVVYHLGDWGKEPMIVLLGEDPVDLARMVASIGEELHEVD